MRARFNVTAIMSDHSFQYTDIKIRMHMLVWLFPPCSWYYEDYNVNVLFQSLSFLVESQEESSMDIELMLNILMSRCPEGPVLQRLCDYMEHQERYRASNLN